MQYISLTGLFIELPLLSVMRQLSPKTNAITEKKMEEKLLLNVVNTSIRYSPRGKHQWDRLCGFKEQTLWVDFSSICFSSTAIFNCLTVVINGDRKERQIIRGCLSWHDLKMMYLYQFEFGYSKNCGRNLINFVDFLSFFIFFHSASKEVQYAVCSSLARGLIW